MFEYSKETTHYKMMTVDELNQAGKNGWELVWVEKIVRNSSNIPNEYIHTFKRLVANSFYDAMEV